MSSDFHDEEYLGSTFALEVDGIELARFTGCSGLGWSTEAVEVKTSDREGRLYIEKRPGRTTYNDIVLKRGLSADKKLDDWYKAIKKGDAERKNGSIVVYSLNGDRKAEFKFEYGWPKEWSASDLDAGSDDPIIEELTIVHERLERVK